MPNKIANRVKMTVSGTPGTGTITLGSAVAGFQSFAGAGVSNADTVPYIIEDGAAWEIGVGTYTSSGTTMTRSVTASSNSGNAISATSAAIVMISPLAADLQAGTAANNLVALDGSAKLPAVDGSALTTLNASNISSGTLAVASGGTGTTTSTGTGSVVLSNSPTLVTPALGTPASGNLSNCTFPTFNQNTTGTASNVTGTVGVANGGTGLTSLTAGYIPFGAGTSAFSSVGNLIWDGAHLSLGANTADVIALRLRSVNSNAAALQFTNDPVSVQNASIIGLDTGELRFAATSFASFSTNGSERMRIDSSGNVGIGTSSPISKMQIMGDISAYSGGNSADAGGSVFFGVGALSNYTPMASIKGVLFGAAATELSGGIAFQTRPYNVSGGQALTERMRITSSGYVGIGTSSPGEQLSIAGGANVYASMSSTGGIKAQISALDATGGGAVGTVTNHFLGVYTNNTERMRIDSSGNVLVTGVGGLGYGTGSGGAVTQATSRTTGVTLNKTNGAITLVSAAGSTTYNTFTVTNSTVAATDTVIVNQKSGTDKYIVLVTAVAAGSFNITFATTSGTTTEQPVFNFAVIKAVTA